MGLVQDFKPLLAPHYITNVFLAVLYFILKTTPGVCSFLFTTCTLELREWEWLTFLGCVVVLKNRKQANVVEYVSSCCMFTKALGVICFFSYNPGYAILYILLCLGHLMFFPEPVYEGPESIVYFRGHNLQEELDKDKRVTWLVTFYVAWSPKCVNFAPVFAELSHEYCLDNLKFGKLDISKHTDIAQKYNISTGPLSRQLPTVILFQEGKEKERRPWPTKTVTLKFDFKKENVIKDFGLNDIYSKSKKALSLRKKDKKEEEEKKDK